MHDLVRDLRMARRALGRSPGFTIALAASLVPAWRAAALEPQAVLRGD